MTKQGSKWFHSLTNSLLSNGYRGQSGRGVELTTHLHLVQRSRTRGAIPPLPLYVFIAWWLVKHKGNFAFTFTFAGSQSKQS